MPKCPLKLSTVRLTRKGHGSLATSEGTECKVICRTGLLTVRYHVTCDSTLKGRHVVLDVSARRTVHHRIPQRLLDKC